MQASLALPIVVALYLLTISLAYTALSFFARATGGSGRAPPAGSGSGAARCVRHTSGVRAVPAARPSRARPPPAVSRPPFCLYEAALHLHLLVKRGPAPGQPSARSRTYYW